MAITFLRLDPNTIKGRLLSFSKRVIDCQVYAQRHSMQTANLLLYQALAVLSAAAVHVARLDGMQRELLLFNMRHASYLVQYATQEGPSERAEAWGAWLQLNTDLSAFIETLVEEYPEG